MKHLKVNYFVEYNDGDPVWGKCVVDLRTVRKITFYETGIATIRFARSSSIDTSTTSGKYVKNEITNNMAELGFMEISMEQKHARTEIYFTPMEPEQVPIPSFDEFMTNFLQENMSMPKNCKYVTKKENSMTSEIVKYMERKYPRFFADQPKHNKLEVLIDRIIFNDPVTVVLWKDGTKTVSRPCQEEKKGNKVIVKADKFNEDTGFAMCVAKYFASRSQIQKMVAGAHRQEKKK